MLRALSLAMLLIAVVLPYFAWTNYQDGNALAQQARQAAEQARTLRAQAVQLSKLPDKPLKPRSAAVADLLVSLRADGELLGGSVRVGLRGRYGRLNWLPVKHGVFKTSLRLDFTVLESAAPAMLTMVSQLALSRALALRDATIKEVSDVVTMSMKIDVFGR